LTLLVRASRTGQSAVCHAPSQNHQEAIMSRQDANAAFALSSFLQGTNAAYIDDLYARYEQDPASVDAEWR
jgi:2-oxoglutarate dehydrogenase E1 component